MTALPCKYRLVGYGILLHSSVCALAIELDEVPPNMLNFYWDRFNIEIRRQDSRLLIDYVKVPSEGFPILLLGIQLTLGPRVVEQLGL